MESHIHPSCVYAQSVQYSLLWRAGPQELHVLLLMHSPEAHGRKMKAVLIEAEVYSKPVKQVARELQVHACAQIHFGFSTHSKRHAYFPHVCPCLCSVRAPPCGLAACMDRREEASVLLNVVFHHITVKVSTGDWWWITSPPLLRVFPQPVTYSNAEPSSPSLLR